MNDLIVVTIGAAIGYAIRVYYDLTSKKNEIRYNLFYENRIDAIKEFYKACSSYKAAAHTFAIERQEMVKENSHQFLVLISQISLATSNAEIFCSENEMENIRNIYFLYRDEFLFFYKGGELDEPDLNEIKQKRRNEYRLLNNKLKLDFGANS